MLIQTSFFITHGTNHRSIVVFDVLFFFFFFFLFFFSLSFFFFFFTILPIRHHLVPFFILSIRDISRNKFFAFNDGMC